MYGFYMWPILKKINLNNFYFLIPFFFSIFLITFPLILYSNTYKSIFLLIITIYLILSCLETLRIAKKLVYTPLIFLLLISANISPGFGILFGLYNYNKD